MNEINTQEVIESYLKSTKRKGIDKLLKFMEKTGFYTAPCSSNHHLAEDGGLAKHSLNVCDIAMELRDAFGCGNSISTESIIIAALLHDIGKCGQFGKPNYVENVLKSGKASASKPYKTNSELLYVDHEVRAIALIEKHIELTEDEQWAILMHNGLYGPFKYQIQGKETPLYMIIHFADMWASRVTEMEDDNKQEE